MQESPNYRVVVEAEREVAYASPDHRIPWGTRRDSSRNRRFNEKLYALYPPFSTLRILDMGCSGGGFVRECLNDGHLAVGLEGSDYSRRHRRAEWATIPEFLFTCDVTGRFDVSLRKEDGLERLLFDVVTCWELIEHIAEEDLGKVAENVKRHLAPGGMWIMSVSPNEEVIDGVRLHQTVKPRDWWLATFRALGLSNLPGHVEYFNTQFVRGEKYGAPGSFHLVLAADPGKVPPVPRERWTTRLYDRWLGSAPQRFLRRAVTGE